jgi:hypothetical protein
MVLQQLEPQLVAERAHEDGVDIDTVFVTTNPDRDGFEVACGLRADGQAALRADRGQGAAVSGLHAGPGSRRTIDRPHDLLDEPKSVGVISKILL